MAQTGNSPPVSSVFAVLINSLESKNATAGQELILRTVSDVIVNGEIVIPRDSKMLGHVTQVINKGKDGAQSGLAIVIDKAVKKDGAEIPVQAIIAAVAAPKNGSLSSDPAYGMMHSNEPKMTGTGAGSAAGTGTLSPSSKASSTAAVATADLKGRMDEPFSLNENSQGAVGYEGLSLSWGLASPPPFTVFASKRKNLKLESGTQMLLRMAPPRLAK
ncbi:MAG TPA: hypothetical protein VHE60_19045 [Pyrinomonadaceae bacterium]|nr:hypothetical protein [Pyrinomonadaceae bacterium]